MKKSYLQSVWNRETNNASAYRITTKDSKQGCCEYYKAAKYFQSKTKPPDNKTTVVDKDLHEPNEQFPQVKGWTVKCIQFPEGKNLPQNITHTVQSNAINVDYRLAEIVPK